MKKLIKCTDSWDFGLGFGMRLGMEKYVGLHFDGMKKSYLDAFTRINDKDLIKELHSSLYTNDRSREGFDCLLNMIDYYHREQMIREKEKQDL